MKYFYTLCLLFLSHNLLHAQCSFSVSTVTTESRCKESGTITVNVSPSGTYVYQIVAGPLTTATTSINFFQSLPSGTYSVAVSDGACTTTTTAVVAGNYVEPGLVNGYVTNNVACIGGTGCLFVNEPVQGRLPYSYSVLQGNTVVQGPQSGQSFCGLAAGSYTIQAYDSCGIVRTSNLTIGIDTGNFFATVYGYSISFLNCNDIIVCPQAGFNNTSSHRLMKLWYVTPTNDTIKNNGFEIVPLSCDTLIGEAHNYGTWQLLAFDTCGRVRQSSFSFLDPKTYVSIDPRGQVCNGYQIAIANNWKYDLSVGYIVQKCSDSSVVYSTTQNPPTTFFSPNILLDFGTCYVVKHYNSCGDTATAVYSTSAKSVFDISLCAGTACATNGAGGIMAGNVYGTGTRPITFTIIDGPDSIGKSIVQSLFASYVNIRDLPLGTYTLEGVDDCGERDTAVITLNTGLDRKITVTPSPNCSGGTDFHVNIKSNFNFCLAQNLSQITQISTTNPGYAAVNVSSTLGNNTTPSNYDADLVNVAAGNLLVVTYAYEGCPYDTNLISLPYTAPVINNATGYLCTASNTGIIKYVQSGGKPNYQYRIKPSASGTWSAFQSSTIFNNITPGVWDVNVVDTCPNGSITSVSFNPWVPANIILSKPCASIGDTITMRPSANIPSINYQWLKNGNPIGSDSVLTIDSVAAIDTGTYELIQQFPDGSCVTSKFAALPMCAPLSIYLEKLQGNLHNDVATLYWQTKSETSDLEFVIEKSSDGVHFDFLSTVAGKSTKGTNYTFIDKSASGKIMYYRLKLISNGVASYSNICVLSKMMHNGNVMLSPNPFTNTLTLNINSGIASDLEIKVTDIAGKIVSRNVAALSIGANTIDISAMIKDFTSGIYFISCSNQEINTVNKIVKQ